VKRLILYYIHIVTSDKTSAGTFYVMHSRFISMKLYVCVCVCVCTNLAMKSLTWACVGRNCHGCRDSDVMGGR